MAETIPIIKIKNNQAFLNPDESLIIEFRPVAGEVVTWANRGEPTVTFKLAKKPKGGGPLPPKFEDFLLADGGIDLGDPGIPPPVIPGGVRMELFNPQNIRVAILETEPVDLGLPLSDLPERQIEFSVPEAQAKKKWFCRFTNISGVPSTVFAHVQFPEKEVTLFTTRIPMRLLNHAARQFFIALGLQVFSHDKIGLISVNEEIEHLTDGVVHDVRFKVPSVPVLFNVPNSRMDRLEIKAKRHPQFGWPLVVLKAGFSGEANILNIEILDFDLSGLEINRVDITLEFSLVSSTPLPALIGNVVIPFVVVKVKVTGEDKGLPEGVDLDDIEDTIKDTLTDFFLRQEVRSAMMVFLTEGFIQLAQRGNKLWSLTADNKNFIVKHFKVPRVRGGGSQLPDFQEAEAKLAGELQAVAGGGNGNGAPAQPPPNEPILPVVIPGVAPGELAALRTKIKNIVVLTMENRSFDHMLGYLTVRGGRSDVDGLTGDESNTNPNVETAPGVLQEVKVNPLRRTLFRMSPHHDHKNVLKQVADGKMSGFLANFLERFKVVDPRFGMGFYTEEQVDTYDKLAKKFAVCDRWFCSHPGPTMLNRITMLTGKTPILDNYAPSDPKIAYLMETTIFDYLTAFDVSWAYYEHDLAFLRLFNRYRLDDKNVLPCIENNPDCSAAENFFSRAKNGTLPQVTFIDPDFVDIPPDRSASDDHPPADIKNGQELVRRIYNALVESPQWKNMLFIITYDEHGGFYDHVPPPGTKFAPGPTNSAPKIHPDGPAFLGARVPTLVISPWVKAKHVEHTVFDHTSIIKTIVMCFIRPAKILNILERLSERTKNAAHLGVMLKNDKPRLSLSALPGRSEGAKSLINQTELQPALPDFHETAQRFAIPKI